MSCMYELYFNHIVRCSGLSGSNQNRVRMMCISSFTLAWLSECSNPSTRGKSRVYTQYCIKHVIPYNVAQSAYSVL
jgi:hypothetical protein